MSTTTTPTNERLENGYFVNSDGLLFVIVNRHPYRLKPPVNLPGLKRGSYTKEQIAALLSGNDANLKDRNA